MRKLPRQSGRGRPWSADRRVRAGWAVHLQRRRRKRATPEVIPVPNAPSELRTVSEVGYIALSWTDQSDDETGFRLYRKPYNEAYVLLDQLPVNQINYVDWTAELGVPYTYYAVAYNDSGESARSNEAAGSVAGG